LKYLKRK